MFRRLLRFGACVVVTWMWLVVMPRAYGLSKATASLSCHRRQALVAGIGSVGGMLLPPPPASNANAIPSHWNLGPHYPGVDFPRLALNTAGLDRAGTERALASALAVGISHVEFHPGVERDGVASVLNQNLQTTNESPPRRSSFFLTTKIETQWERNLSPGKARGLVHEQLDRDLRALGVDYLDMVLLRESLDCDVMVTMWKALEDQVESGRVRSLGVANYCRGALECLLSTAQKPPAVNYIMVHPGMGPVTAKANASRAYGEAKGVRTLAYGHLGERLPAASTSSDDTQQLLDSPVLRKIAHNRGKSVDEISLRWVLQGGAAASIRPSTRFALGKSYYCSKSNDDECLEGLRASSGVFGWSLTPTEMRAIDRMVAPTGNPTIFSSPGCPGSFFS